MSMRKQAFAAGIIGLLLAVGLIAGSAVFIPQTNPNQVTTLGNSISTGATSAKTPTNANAGTLDVLLTDPPTVPSGVTAIYVSYSNVAVHVSSAGNQSGWTNSNTTGTINLIGLVNVSSTIASIQVGAGQYNALRFNVSNALVTYNGKNYTAFVTKAELNVAIPGGIPVNATNSSAAIIDMHPTVVNIGSLSTPEFVISTAATCYSVPQKNVTGDMDHDGNRIDLNTAQWWKQISEQSTANITTSSASLKQGGLSLTITNTGTTSINLTALFVTPLGNECITPSTTTTNSSTTTSSTTTSTSTSNASRGDDQQQRHDSGGHEEPQCLTGSATFLLLDNGTAVTVNSTLPTSPGVLSHLKVSWDLFGQTGYALGPGKSLTLNYTGSISFGDMTGSNHAPLGVISGDQYEMVVVGQDALTATIVVAS